MRRYSMLAAICLCFSVAQAQNPNTANGYIPGHTYQGSDIDTVDVGSGNLTLKIPIRSYKQEGSESIDFYLYFPGKHFQAFTGMDGIGGDPGMWLWVDPRDPVPWDDPQTAGFFTGVYLMTNQDWHSAPESTAYGDVMMSPDGASHLFIPTNDPYGIAWSDPEYPPNWSADASGYGEKGGYIIDSSGIGRGDGTYVDRNFPVLQVLQDTAHTYSYAYIDADGTPQSASYNLSNLTDMAGRTLPFTNGYGPPGKSVSLALCPAVSPAIPGDSLQPAYTNAFEVDFPGAYNPNTNGNYDAYILCYAPVKINTYFDRNLSGSPTPLTQTMQFLKAVLLPNGQSWKFQYDDANLNSSGYGYGDLTQVAYPSGAYIQYAYTNNPSPCLIGNDSTQFSRYMTQKTEYSLDTPPAMWTYSVPNVTATGTTAWNEATGTVTEPDGTVQSYKFAELGSTSCPAYEIGFLDGKGGGRITVNTVTGYSALEGSGTTPSGDFTYSPRFQATWGPNQAPVATSKFYDEEPVLYGNNNTQSSVYISHGSVPYEFTYPYYGPFDLSVAGIESGIAQELDAYMQSPVGNQPIPLQAPTGPLPSGITKYVKTEYEYQFNASVENDNLIDLVRDKTVYDGFMNKVAYTLNAYDDGPSNILGLAPASPSGTGIWWPGFLASTTAWMGSDGTTQQIFTPDPHAEVASVTDANGHMTSYTRDPNGINVIAVAAPSVNGVSHVTQSSYYPETGQIAKQTDENGNITKYFYGPMARLIKVLPPATSAGQPEVDLCYTDLQSCPIVGTTPLTVVSQTLQKTGGPFVSISQTYDAFGRPVNSFLYDGQGPNNGPIETDTGYDNLGRKTSVTNPYRPPMDTTIDGSTSYEYTYPDSFTDEVETIHPDGSTSISKDALGVNTSIDGNGNSTVRTTDIFGNLISVAAPIGGAAYTYDLLNDLIRVQQAGATRTFQYDAVSRLMASYNPETGAGSSESGCSGWSLCYSYDLAGNLQRKIDSRGVVTTLAYDAINRVLSKSYSGAGPSTPTTCYQYDLPVSGATGANFIGRLTAEWTQSPSVGACANTIPATGTITSHRILAYDAGGRVLLETRCVLGSQCVLTKNQYDLVGNLLQYETDQSDPAGTIITGTQLKPVIVINTYDMANRLKQVASQLGSTLPQNIMYLVNTFSPAGPTSVSIGSTMTTTHTYDIMMRPTSETTVKQ